MIKKKVKGQKQHTQEIPNEEEEELVTPRFKMDEEEE
jgi:hypothetical protein